jgi:putative transposase
MTLSYKFLILPNKETARKLLEALDACRWLYNELLEKINIARDEGRKLSTYETQNLIPNLKVKNPSLGGVYSKVLQMVNYTLHSNISSLAALKKRGKKVGHLRYKGKGWYNTLNYNQSGFKIDQDHSRLHLSKIGDIKIKLHQKIEGRIKAVLIKREGKNWYAIVQADQEPEILPQTGRSVGIDVGLKVFAVDSDGNSIENPRYADRSAKKLAKYQRRLARCKKGSSNRKKIKAKISKTHKRINNQRDDFLHKLSRLYVNNYDNICIEDMDVKNLIEKDRDTGKHRSIHDVAWAKFAFMLLYKAQSAGRKLIAVDPHYTSQRCSCCGCIVKKELSDRVHDCPYCGFSSDRDYNAAVNILSAGMEQPVAPIESKSLHHISVMQVLAMTWEALPFRVG